ncbi:hypothetical protein FRB97_004627 [Tulasnella sp. 331]|nr:hypothetical protein FRB97_004627 [Tulasnella sp. 331]
MAPLGKAKQTTFVETRDDGTKVYTATMDPEWTITAVPFGGFTMALVLNAAIQSQQNTSHEDIIYITCFFLKAVSLAAECTEIHIKPMRPGKIASRFTHLRVDLFQDDTLKITANLIFGSMSLEAGPNLPIGHRPKCPVKIHPGTVMRFSRKYKMQNFSKHFEWAIDKSASKNHGEVVFGAWTEFADKSGEEKLEADTLGAEDPDYANMDMWWPSVVISLEFKVKLPLEQPGSGSGSTVPFAPTTLGHFSRKSHVRNGRYTDLVELWTAPCSIRDEKCVVDEDWRERMVCVAVGGQMGLIVPATLNARHRSTPAKPKL